MKLIYSFTKRLILCLIFPAFLSAQKSTDYSIQLKSSQFIPHENFSGIKKNDEVFQKSLFNEKHYITIQFLSLPDEAMKKRLSASGIELIDYIPNNAFTASIPTNFKLSEFKSFPLRSVLHFSARQKAIPEIFSEMVPEHAIKKAGYADMIILTYEKLSTGTISNTLLSIDATILEDMPYFRTFTIRVAKENIDKLVALPFIQWVEFISPPNQVENLPGRTLHRVNVLNDGPRNLKGDGINIGIWDAGQISPHIDFLPTSRLNQIEFNSVQSHSTHCSGTILGRGLLDPRARGMAANANLYSWNYNGDVQNEMAIGIPQHNLIVSSHSYNDGGAISCNLNGTQIAYTLRSRNTDINLNNNPAHLHCHSAGNNQTSCANGWFTITGTGKSAKNNIVVGSLTSTEAISSFSSYGPVADGRVKPEITSMGTNVYSTYTPLNTYATISGTSMSTPGVAGSVALLVQRYKQLNSNNLPPSPLIKNIVCNNAADLGNPGPDYRFGFGRINVLSAVRVLEDNRYVINSMSTGGSNDIAINVPAGAARLRVMLTWNDPAGAANANPALVNNLDLTVINGATTTLPWILDRNNPANIATKAIDNISNIEQVTIDNPASGSYTLRTVGTSIPMGPQEYSLTWSIEQPYIEIIYPNGGESFNPGTTELITWDNAGITSAQTVEYSLDNGANWTVLSTTVPANTTRLSWSVPASNTSTARVRVSNGALSDASDVTFRILGTPLNFNTSATCIGGSIDFVWSAVTNATHYDIYSLNTGTGQWEVVAGNVTGVAYTLTGQTPGANMWFTIKAKNNTTGAESERAFAINRTISSGGSSTIGNISGENSICGIRTNVPYSVASVSGASSYTWGVPPGAIITNGQGTNSIQVDYPGGSSSGNVSVFATAAACQTATVTLAITVGGLVAAPASGGNQLQTNCPPDPIPTLTATASVPSGHTVIWYDAPAGGNVISNPILNSIGTITYYATSSNNSTGCESAIRTAVTLTINQAPPPIIAAGGPTSFCQGGSVTLTANAGNSYSWSNGATSQSITVIASGTFTVTITQPGYCVRTSSPITVTVTAPPPVIITPGGATTFCDGGNVVLSSTAGNSYLWSNGATTQSITASTSGNYSVTVTQANGCVSIAAPVAVTVNPNPAVTLSALPFTRLFPGLSTTLSASVISAGPVTYSWIRNGTAVSGATSSTLPVTLTALGNYAVTAINTFGCSGTSSIVSIADSATSKLFIFPNPNSGLFQVSYYNSGTNSSYTMTIFDAKGARVLTKAFSINGPYDLMDVDMRKFGRGVYRVVISDRNGKRLATGGVILQ